MDFKAILQSVVSWLMTEGVKVVVGLIVLWILFKVINVVCKRFTARLAKKKADETLSKFAISALRVLLKLLALVAFVGYVGLETSSIAGVITSCGIALGLALQGSLSNLAGGIVLLVMRPFKIGDYIEAQGQGGTVENIRLFYTNIVTPDNKVVMLPNAALASGVITNYSIKDTRRVEWKFAIDYNADIQKAKGIILDCIEASGYANNEPEAFVNVLEHGDSAIIIVARVWTDSANYWALYFKLMESVKVAFDEQGIEIPYQHLDVNIKK